MGLYYYALLICQISFLEKSKSLQEIDVSFSPDILDCVFSYCVHTENAYHMNDIDTFAYRHSDLKYKTSANQTNSKASSLENDTGICRQARLIDYTVVERH